MVEIEVTKGWFWTRFNTANDEVAVLGSVEFNPNFVQKIICKVFRIPIQKDVEVVIRGMAAAGLNEFAHIQPPNPKIKTRREVFKTKWDI